MAHFTRIWKRHAARNLTEYTMIYCGRAGRPDHDKQHCYHHAPKVKPEAATAVAELLMMGVRTPKTC